MALAINLMRVTVVLHHWPMDHQLVAQAENDLRRMVIGNRTQGVSPSWWGWEDAPLQL